MDFFWHPWFMVAGGALVSLPIIIHLINRMRFKRIRWAAMEFLLKSQKRNRRRLIIEQLILLALRCLLIALAGLLVARLKYGGSGQLVTHIVVLDDTLSMADRSRDKGQVQSAFDTGKDQIVQLARSAVQARTPQQMRVLLLSDLTQPIFDRPLKDSTISDLTGVLSRQKPTFLHVDPLAGVERGHALFADVPTGQKVLHLVSDFRDSDWASGPRAEKLAEAVDHLVAANINLSLIDTATPSRGKTRQLALHHDNLAVVDLHAETRVAPVGVPVELTVTIDNFSPSEASTFLHVRVDGTEDFGASRPLSHLKPGRNQEKFTLLFAKNRDTPEVKENDPAEERERKRLAEREYRQVTAEIDPEQTGLNADNVRDLVVEVRRKVPILVVDGSGPEGRLPGGDMFHLDVALRAAQSFDVERRTVEDLEKTDLDLYPSIILLNVPEVKSDKVLKRLDEYVRKGGSLAYFLGDRVKPGFYNDTLFKKYAGLFPLLIDDRKPYDSVDPNGSLTEEERQERRQERLQKDAQPKVLFPDDKHPLAANLARHSSVYRYLAIDRYYKALPRSQWDPDKHVEDVVILPNDRSIDDYKGGAQQLAARAVELTRDLASAQPEFEKYVPVVERYQVEVKRALTTPFLFNLIKALDALLKTPGNREEGQPDMPELWAQSRMKALGQEIAEFRDRVQNGDPLVVSTRHGKGRVIADLTSAGKAWNNWCDGSMASYTFEIFMMDLEAYLTGGSDDFNRLVGDELTLQFPAARYQPRVRWKFQPQPDPGAQVEGARPGTPPPAEGPVEQPLALANNVLTFQLNETRRPGVYSFEFFPLAATDGAVQSEPRAYAFNVDADAESNLKRATREKLERNRPTREAHTGTIALRSAGDDFEAFKERQPDLSESPWLYLFILVILVVEQALAVHLSFHLKDSGSPGVGPRAVGEGSGNPVVGQQRSREAALSEA